MFKYLLTKQVRQRGVVGLGVFGNVEMLGTFDSIDNVNEYLDSAGYTSNIKFISCRQIIETEMLGIQTRLDLTSIPFNPIDKIGELRNAFEEEDTIEGLLCATNEAGDSLTSQDDELVTVEPRFLGGELFLKFSQFGISLLKDGTWKYEYTGYGSDYAAQEEYNAELRQAEDEEAKEEEYGHRCLICGKLTISYHDHEVK